MVYIIIAVFFLICLFLYIRKVWIIMHERMMTVELAAEQLKIHRAVANDMENKYVLERSENIYSQAVRLYHIALENPFTWLPATLMGFRPIKEDVDSYHR